MTTVEELRDEVVTYCDPWQRDSVIRVLDSLIAAAREDEREKIRAGGEQFSEGDFVEDSDYIGIRYGVHSDNAVANDDIYVVPASLLAPDKESEK